MNWTSLLPFFVIYIGFIAADYCPAPVNVKIQQCVQPVAEYAKVLNNNQEPKRTADLSAFTLPNMGSKVFNELCRLIHRFNQCVLELRRECPRHVTIALIDSSYGYLCNEGYNTFVESAECLMQLDRQPTVKQCHDETLSEIEKANTGSAVAISAKLDRMCSALNFFSDCVRSPIKRECGSSAWQVIYRVLKDTTHTLMPGCQFTGGQSRASGRKQNQVVSTVPDNQYPTSSIMVVTSPVPIIDIVSKSVNKANNEHISVEEPTVRKAGLLNTGSLCSINIILLFMIYALNCRLFF